MGPYNGFSAAQRQRALAWVKKQYAAGTRQRPTRCDACSQDRGIIERHSEDYSEPFGDHIGAYALCFTCHMMVHARRRSLEVRCSRPSMLGITQCSIWPFCMAQCRSRRRGEIHRSGPCSTSLTDHHRDPLCNSPGLGGGAFTDDLRDHAPGLILGRHAANRHGLGMASVGPRADTVIIPCSTT
jgi:hypothetical protein